MSSLLPVAVYGLKVPAGDVMIPASVDFPATFRITMAAIDPSAKPEYPGTLDSSKPLRATLKVVYDPSGPGAESDSDEDEEETDALERLLAGEVGEDDGDEESSADDEEVNGGPSDQSKTKKARKEAAVQQIMKALAEQGEEESDEEMEVDDTPKTNGVKANNQAGKGKAKALDTAAKDDDEDEADDEEISADGLEEIVVCTLDPDKSYQQTLDLTIPEDQNAFFKVSGNYAIYLTGNYVIPNEESSGKIVYEDDDPEDEYESVSEENELLDDDESDELDNLEDPRITEVVSGDEEEVPKLVSKVQAKTEEAQKRMKKRAAEDSEDEPASLDDIMAKALKPEDANGGEQKLSKKQFNNFIKTDGKAAVSLSDSNVKQEQETKDKAEKKVSFTKNLEQPPSASSNTVNGDSHNNQKPATKQEASKKGVKIVQGVKVDDRKVGKGPAAKKGDKVGMRYIGKLADGKVFDANKKGPAFKFKLGDGSVIPGWDIGVTGMQVGGERRIIIPAHLAYGKKRMPDIPPNSELTFDLKLLEIQ